MDISELMHRAVDTLDPDTEPLVAGALARGRRLRRHRAATQFGSALALCGLVAGAATAMVESSGPSGAGGMQAAHAETSTAAAPSVSASPAGPVLNRQSVLRTFRSLLPNPTATVSMRHGSQEPSDGPGYVGVTLTYDDGHGNVQIAVSVQSPPAGGGLGGACEISTCTTTADGSTLSVYQGSDRPGQPYLQPRMWEVSLQRPNTTTIQVTEWNSMTEKTPGSITRDLPPLTIAQLTAIVSSPTWTELVPPAAGPITTPAGPGSGQKLAPERLRTTRTKAARH